MPLRLSKRWCLAAGLHFMHNTAVPPGPNSPIPIPTASSSWPQPSSLTLFPFFAKSFAPLQLHFPLSCAARCCPLSICGVTPGRSRIELAGHRSVSWRTGRNCWPGPKARRGRSSAEGGVASGFRPPAEPDHGPGTCQLRGSRGSRRASLVAAWAAPMVGG